MKTNKTLNQQRALWALWLITADRKGSYLAPWRSCCVPECNRSSAAYWQECITTIVRCAGIAAVLLIATCVGRAADLPRPGEAIDAGDSYRLKDGSRVALRRVVNEVAIETWG